MLQELGAWQYGYELNSLTLQLCAEWLRMSWASKQNLILPQRHSSVGTWPFVALMNCLQTPGSTEMGLWWQDPGNSSSRVKCRLLEHTRNHPSHMCGSVSHLSKHQTGQEVECCWLCWREMRLQRALQTLHCSHQDQRFPWPSSVWLCASAVSTAVVLHLAAFAHVHLARGALLLCTWDSSFPTVPCVQSLQSHHLPLVAMSGCLSSGLGQLPPCLH